jgi:hypothetical protein
MVAAESIPPGVGTGDDSTTNPAPVQEQCIPPTDQADIDFYLLATNGDKQQLRDIEAAICHPR